MVQKTEKAMKVEQKEEVKPEIKEEIKPDLDLYGKLRNEIIAGRDNFSQQLKQVKEAILTKTKEIENLRMAELKLSGAVEASDIYLKAILPTNNPS